MFSYERTKEEDGGRIKKILACYVDKKSLKDKGMDYDRNNEELAVEVKDLLDGVKDHLQIILHLDFCIWMHLF